MGVFDNYECDNQLSLCDSCRHYRYSHCYLKECVYEQRLSCEGCVDHKKKTYKGTQCLKGCKRYCYSPAVVVGDTEDKWRIKQ